MKHPLYFVIVCLALGGVLDCLGKKSEVSRPLDPTDESSTEQPPSHSSNHLRTSNRRRLGSRRRPPPSPGLLAYADPKKVEPRIAFGTMCPHNITRDFLMKKNWQKYRFSDALQGNLRNPVESVRTEYAEQFGSTNIVSEYYAKTDSVHLRPDILYEVLKPKLLTTVRKDTAVLHLRLGDTTCIDCWDKMRHIKLTNRLAYYYVFSKAYYEHILQSLKTTTDVTSVIITASTYHGHITEETFANAMEYVKLVRDLFSDHGYQVSQRINCATPDEDIVFMASHKYFITGGGGYSQLVGKMVQNNGGQVFYDPNYICELTSIRKSKRHCNWETLCDLHGVIVWMNREDCEKPLE